MQTAHARLVLPDGLRREEVVLQERGFDLHCLPLQPAGVWEILFRGIGRYRCTFICVRPVDTAVRVPLYLHRTVDIPSTMTGTPNQVEVILKFRRSVSEGIISLLISPSLLQAA